MFPHLRLPLFLFQSIAIFAEPRLRAEGQALQKEVNEKVHGDHTCYGSEDGAWRHYIHQRLPHGVAPRRSQRFRPQ